MLVVVPAAYWIRLRLPQLRPLVEFITLLPLVIPAIVIVFGYIRMYGSNSSLPFLGSARGTDVLLVIGYATLALPYMYRAVDTGLRTIDVRTLTEAAQILGAGWTTIITRVILPNVLDRGAVRRVPDLRHRHRRVHHGEPAEPARPSVPTCRTSARTAPTSRRRSRSSPSPSPGAACRSSRFFRASRRDPRTTSKLRPRQDTDVRDLSQRPERPQGLRQQHGRAGFQPRRRARRVRVVPRPLRLRQDDGAAHGRRLRGADRRLDRHRRQGRHAAEAEPAQHRHGVPGLRAVPKSHRGAEHRLRAEGRAAPPSRRSTSAWRRCWS